jgi:hypothetical protein
MNFLHVSNLITDILSVLDESKLNHTLKVGRLLAEEGNKAIVWLKSLHEEQQKSQQQDENK